MLLPQERCVEVPPDAPGLPAAARALLATGPVLAYGPLELLASPLLALFCSATAPPALILRAHDIARDLRDLGAPTVGGFHSPVERDALAFLLRGAQPVVVCPARALEGMRLPAPWREPLAGGRLLLLSAARGRRRPTAAMADRRNRLAAALAERLFVVHATPGGRVYRLARESMARGQPVLCFDHPANRDLVLLGARPVRGAAECCGVAALQAHRPAGAGTGGDR